MNGTDALFGQLVILSASLVLLFGLALLLRRSLPSFTSAFHFVLKVLVIPHYLKRLQLRTADERESQPYVNIAASLIVAGLLVVLAYIITRPLVVLSSLPTREALPLAMGLIFVGLVVITSRRKALTQVVGFLVLENGIAMLAILATYGIPLIIELGVFLDVLMGFLAMQIFVYHIHGTFESIDVEQLSRLKH